MCTYCKWCLYHQHSDNKQNHRGDKERQRLDFSSFVISSPLPPPPPPPRCFRLYFLVTQWLHLNITIAGTTIGHYCWWKKPLWLSGFHNCQISRLWCFIPCEDMQLPWRTADLYSCQIRSSKTIWPHPRRQQIGLAVVLTVYTFNTLSPLSSRTLLLPDPFLRVLSSCHMSTTADGAQHISMTLWRSPRIAQWAVIFTLQFHSLKAPFHQEDKWCGLQPARNGDGAGVRSGLEGLQIRCRGPHRSSE